MSFTSNRKRTAAAVPARGPSRTGFRPTLECLEGRTLLNASPATHLGISLSATSATVGASLSVTLTALDANNNLAVGYPGTVHFTSTDPAAILPGDYTFTAADNSVHTFTVTFNTAGNQTITATDTTTATLTGSAGLPVNNPLPTVTGLGTATAVEGGAALTLTVAGTNFLGTSVVQWNGQPLATTFVSATQLTATVPAADLAEEGAFPVTVVNPTPGGGASTAQTFTVTDAPLTVTGQAISPAEGTAFNGVLATFTDAGGLESTGTYQVTIDWGDGTTPTAGTVSPGTGGALQVTGSHAYAEEGNYTVKVTVQDDGTSATANATATVADAPLTVTTAPVSTTEGAAFAGVVATVTDAGGLETPATYKAMIDWGDGTAPTAGVIGPGSAGTLQVTGSHTYAEDGTYTVKVTVQEDVATTTAGGTATVADAPLTATPTTVGSLEGRLFSATLASFTDADPAATASYYKATANWGDGTAPDTTVAVLPIDATHFAVVGRHQYAVYGRYPVTVQMQDAGGSKAAVTSTVIINDAPLQALGVPVTVPQGVKAVGVPVAFFSDPGGNLPLGSYSATVSWGDGTATSAGVITQSGGILGVTGSHNYATPGRFTLYVTIHDKGGTAITARSSAVVGTADERFVAQLYQDLLHRPVDLYGLSLWTGQLAKGVSRQQVALGIETSPEYRSQVVQAMYLTYLHRPADPTGLTSGMQFLVNNRDEQLAALLIDSPEYFQNRGGGTAAGYLTALYQDVLGKALDPTGQALYTKELANGMSRAAVALQVLTSWSGEQTLAQNLYRRFTHKVAPLTTVNQLAQVLQQGGKDEAVIAAIVGSPDYAALL